MILFISPWLQLITQIAQGILSALPILAEILIKNRNACGVGFLLCFATNCILDPSGAINQFMITCIDLITSVFPSTPDNYKLANLLYEFSQQVPSIGWGAVNEIFEGIFGMLAIYLSYKIYKTLPFT